MPLDDTSKHGGGGGDGDDDRHSDLADFVISLADTNVLSCEINGKCVGCSMHALGVHILGKWLAFHLHYAVKEGLVSINSRKAVEDFVASELRDIREGIEKQYTAVLKDMAEREERDDD